MPAVTLCTFNVENLFGRYKVFGYMPADRFKRQVLTPKQLEEQGGFLPGEICARKAPSRSSTRKPGAT